MSGVSVQEMSDTAAALRAAILEHDELCHQLGGDGINPLSGAEGRHKHARLVAHANSTTMNPKLKVAEHDTAAELGSFNEWAELNALQYRLKALKEAMHSYRQILSAYQTQVRVEADFDRTVPS